MQQTLGCEHTFSDSILDDEYTKQDSIDKLPHNHLPSSGFKVIIVIIIITIVIGSVGTITLFAHHRSQ